MPLPEWAVGVSGVALTVLAYLIINIALITHAWLGAGNKFTLSSWLSMCRGVFSSGRGPSR